MVTEERKETSWETEIGLPNDIDAWITNPRFGEREEYAAKVVAATPGAAALMFLIDLVDEGEELVATQGFSIGKDWIPSDDGLTISHPKRKNVVTTSMYGQLQNRVVGDLKVDMDQYGLPTQAMSWDRLGFHWMLLEHETIKGEKKSGLMPVEFLGKKEGAVTKVPAKTKARPAAVAGLESKLVDLMAEYTDVRKFQLAAIRMPEVAANDELMASVLDEGPDGFWATHQR